MGPLLRRELLVIVRRPGVIVAWLAMAAVLTAFLLVWPHGMPLGSRSAYAQARLLTIVVFALVGPWVVARSASPERGDALAILAAQGGWSPAAIVATKALAHALMLDLVATTLLPPLLLAQQASALPPALVAADMATLASIATLTAGVTTVCTHVVRGRLASWLVATGVGALCLLLVSRLWPGMPWGEAVAASLGVLTVAAASLWSRTAFIYLRGAHA